MWARPVEGDPLRPDQGGHRAAPLPRWLEAVPRVPLFVKIFTAGALLMAAVGAVALTMGGGTPAAAWALVALLPALLLHALLVHLALRPLRVLEETFRRVEAGDLAVRVPASVLADRTMTRLNRVLNRMLESWAVAHQRQHLLASRIQEVEEGERERIAHQLFDDTGQLLSSLLLRLEVAQRALESPGSTSVERSRLVLDGARGDALSALAGVQRIARELRPPELGDLGPSAALEIQLRRLTAGTGVRVHVEGDRVDPCLSPQGGVTLYRVLQEGGANALRHGGPSTLRLHYSLAPGSVRVELRDDGQGFDVDEALRNPGRSLGLLRMMERARLSGGGLRFRSAPGEGTRVLLELPRCDLPTPSRPPLPGASLPVDVGENPTVGKGLCRTDAPPAAS